MGIIKKSTHGGAGRGQGRKSRADLGLEPTIRVMTQVEQSIIDVCRKKYGSLPAALRFAAAQAKEGSGQISKKIT